MWILISALVLSVMLPAFIVMQIVVPYCFSNLLSDILADILGVDEHAIQCAIFGMLSCAFVAIYIWRLSEFLKVIAA